MNDLSFVMRVVDMLEDARLRVWLFGGWAEELRGLRAPCEHADVDFLSYSLADAVTTSLAERLRPAIFSGSSQTRML